MRRLLLLVLTLSLSLLGARPHRTGGRGATGRASGTRRREAAKPSDRPKPPPWLKVENGATQPQFDLADAVEETLFVETTVDSDLDGKRDRVRLQLSRPGETESSRTSRCRWSSSTARTATTPAAATNHNVDFDVMPQEGIQPNERVARWPRASRCPRRRRTCPASLDNYWVPRGYAVVLGESIGTGFSDGCPTVGDKKETLGTKAIIDWLNGRAPAWNEAGEPVTADWTTGDVGMTGVSYNGTLPNQVATTGVEGLRTIVPVSAISSWYDYYRANGLVRAPHSNKSGVGENGFQGEDLDVLAEFVEGPTRMEKCRHIVEEMLHARTGSPATTAPTGTRGTTCTAPSEVKASVFVVHGLEDYNVMPKAFTSWWAEAARNGVPRKIWLHNGGHGGPSRPSGYQQTLNRWMDYWLFGVRQRDRDLRAAGRRAAPGRQPTRSTPTGRCPAARDATLHLGATNATQPGTLATRPQSRARSRGSRSSTGAGS